MAVNLIDSDDISVVQSGNDITLNQKFKNIYSTSEVKIGKWINNKPIYRKVIQSTTPSSNSPTSIGSISNMDLVINIYGSIVTSTQNILVNFVYNTEQNSCYRENNNIILRVTASSYQEKTCYIVVEYTKTTD